MKEKIFKLPPLMMLNRQFKTLVINMVLMQLEVLGLVDPAQVPSPVDARTGG